MHVEAQAALPHRLTAVVLRSIWFLVVPALVALVTLRFFVPDALHANEDWFSQFLARARADFAVPVGALVFLLTLYVFGYFRAYLPGAALLAEAQRKGSPRALLLFLVVVVVAALFFRSSVFTSYRILSASMLPTLEQGDVVGVEKFAYGLRIPGLATPIGASQPRRGEVIVFRAPAGYAGPPELIKRVVGLPGDTISMRGGHVRINGWEAPSCEAGPYVYVTKEYAEITRVFVEFLEGQAYLATFTPLSPAWEASFRVPPGQVFVLGDNRSSSEDSRAWNEGQGGALRLDHIIGRADRTLIGTLRNGVVDTEQFLKPLNWYPGKSLNLEGMNTEALRQAVEACLGKQPANTSPPPPSALL